MAILTQTLNDLLQGYTANDQMDFPDPVLSPNHDTKSKMCVAWLKSCKPMAAEEPGPRY